MVGQVGLFILVKLLTVVDVQFDVVLGFVWTTGCFSLNQVKAEKTDTKIYRVTLPFLLIAMKAWRTSSCGWTTGKRIFTSITSMVVIV